MAIGRKIAVGALALVALILAAAVLFYFLAPLADIRTAEARSSGATPEAMARGKRLLEEAARRHGLEAWQGYQTTEIIATDRWAGSSPWWPQPQQRFRAARLLGTFTSQVELLDGGQAGEVWGIQSWHPYRRDAATAPPRFSEEPDPPIEFYLPTLQYFDELPFRLLSADVVTWAGEVAHGGRTYQRVLATWGSLEPNAEHDQYDVWIDEESGLVSKVQYTVRDAEVLSGILMKPLMRMMAVGTMHYADYREVGGVMFPFVQSVTLGSPDAAEEPVEENYFHQLQAESVAFDTIERASLLPDASLPPPADAKAAQ